MYECECECGCECVCVSVCVLNGTAIRLTHSRYIFMYFVANKVAVAVLIGDIIIVKEYCYIKYYIYTRVRDVFHSQTQLVQHKII